MRFGVLGPLMVWDGDGEPVRVPEAKVRALLADLLVHEGRPVSADRLIDDLWGEEPPGNPANALQAKVSQLRRVLGRDRVVHQLPGYRLGADEAVDEVDADQFRALVAEARTVAEPRDRAALLTRALELWRGPAYADFADEEFVRAAAQRLTEQRLGVLEEQAEARLASGDHTLLLGELADRVGRYPLRERLRAVQMRALYLAGRQSEALASYAELRGRLADELGLDPGPEVSALQEAILRQDPELSLGLSAPGVVVEASAGGEPAPSSPRGNNLPTPLTALIGRDQPLGDIRQLLAAARLVTLTGPGGVGKTRLAVEAAGRLGDGEVWLIELAALRGGVTDLAAALSATLGIRDDAPSGELDTGEHGAPRTPADRLATALRDRRILLVLDNCEHVVEPVAELTGLLLSRAPGLRVLATSQEPLGLTGEAVYAVTPLQLPDSVRLFTARAAAAAPGFSLDEASPGTLEAVAEICRRLDGIPLALELAAARVRALGVRELAARLGDRFRLLTAGQRGAPDRQRTLRAMIDWSWELLTAQERVVLRRLAVHRDGCTLDGAEAVCADEGIAREEVLDLLARLVDRSLVFTATGPDGTTPRYRLLESVAAYATERLREADEAIGVRDRHLRHYLNLAEQAEPHLRGGGQRVWLGRLDADAVNLRAALDEAVRRAEGGKADAADMADAAVRLATALSWWWLLRGRLNEARTALSAVTDVAPKAAEPRALYDVFALLTGRSPRAGERLAPAIADPLRHGRATWLHAYALFNSGDLAGAEQANARARELVADTGDAWGTAAALGLGAMLALVRGDLATVERDGPRSAELFGELGDRWGELQASTPLAALAEIRGDYAKAERRQREGLRIAEELGLATEVSARLSGLGRLAMLGQEWDRAHELHERARRLAVEQGYLYGEVHALMGLALGARRSGDLDGAENCLLRLRDGYASSPAGEHLLLTELGFTAELRGDEATATGHQLHGLEVALSLGEPRALALSLEGLAGAAALGGTTDGAGRAASLLGAAASARRGVDAPLPASERTDVDRVTAAATAILGEAAFTEAFQRGTEQGAVTAARSVRAALGRAPA